MYQDELGSQRKTKAFPRTATQLFLFIVVFWNSQVLSGTGANPIGIKGVQETLYAILTLFSTIYLLLQAANRSIKRTDVAVFLMIFGAYAYSVMASDIRFNQPFIWGLIEERRILAFLIYFPLVWAFRRKILTIEQVFTWILWSAIICAALSVLVYLNIIHPVITKDIAANSLREDRYSVGAHYISMTVLILLHRFSLSRLVKDFLLILFFLAVLVIIVQTRQILISMAIAMMIVRNPLALFRLNLRKVVKVFFFATVLLTATVWVAYSTSFISELATKYNSLFARVVSDEYIYQSARSQTIASIIGEFKRNAGSWLGSGCLSQLWHNGFYSYYGSTFFLADVGIFGTAYKFGIFAIPLILFYIALQVEALWPARGHPYFRLVLASWSTVLIMMPVGAPIEYRGYISGLLLAATLGCSYELRAKRNLIS